MTNFFNESFIVALCFVIFVYLAYKPIRNAVLASLDAKIKEIKDRLSETENLKKEAKLLLDQVKQEVEAFEERKKTIINSAETSTQRLVDTRVKEMELLLRRKKDSAVKSIENQKERASDQMSIEFTNSVIETVKNYLKETDNNSVSDEEVISHLLKNR